MNPEKKNKIIPKTANQVYREVCIILILFFIICYCYCQCQPEYSILDPETWLIFCPRNVLDV